MANTNLTNQRQLSAPVVLKKTAFLLIMIFLMQGENVIIF